MQKAIDRETALDDELGGRLYGLAAELFPICRSITGEGVRETLQILGRYIGLEVHEVASGTSVLDWVVPREWQVRDAYIADANGQRIVDYRASNLHVLNYSAPIRAKLSLDELKSHIFTLPDQPDLIPYRTSYYEERWGFCMSHKALCELEPGMYEAVIDTSFTEGALTYGEFLKAGDSAEEILLSAHVCHPSLANDNCSGLALLTLLAAELSRRATRYSYRFRLCAGYDWRDHLAGPETGIARTASSTASWSRASATRAGPPIRGAVAEMPRSTASWPTFSSTRRHRRYCRTLCPTATTSGNSARRGSTFPSDSSNEASTGPFPNITRPRTT